MFDERLNDKQICAWTAAGMLAPLAHVSGAGWQAMAAACVVLLPLGMAARSGWKNMGKMLLTVELIWLVAMMAHLLRASGLYWPAKNRLAVPVTLLIVAVSVYQVRKAAKVGAVLLCSMVVLFVPVLLCGISDVETAWLHPEWNDWAWELIPVLLLGGIGGLWHTGQGKHGRSILLIGVYGIAAALITQGVLSMGICAREKAPLYVLAQTLHIGGLSRFEALVSTAVTLGYYATTSLMLCAGIEMAQGLGMSPRTGAAVVAAGVISVWLSGVEISAGVAAVGPLILWGFAPLVCVKKKSKKSEKSA